MLRDWSAATAGFNRAVKVGPDLAYAEIGLAYLEVFQNNNPAAARNILQSIPAGVDPDGMVTSARWDLAMLERDFAAAEKILADFRSKDFPREGVYPKTLSQGRVALARGDVESARRFFAAATPALEQQTRSDPEEPQGHTDLGLLYAYMQTE